MSRLRLLPLLLLLVAPRAWAAIAFDSTAGHAGSNQANTASLTVTITIVAGETAICGVSTSSGSTGITGGGTWTLLIENTSDSSHVETWATPVNGAAAATSIVIGGPGGIMSASCVQYTGVSAYGFTGTNFSGGASSATISLTGTANLSWVVATIFSSNNVGSATVGTLRANAPDVAMQDNTFGGGIGSITNTNALSGGTNDFAANGLELYPSTPLIYFDSAHKGTASGTTTPLSVTVSIISGETGFCAIDLDATTISGVSVASITGGGTWTLVKGVSAAAGCRSELWTNGVKGGSTASSLSIAVTGTFSVVVAACGQYIGAGKILGANAVTAVGTTSTTQTISLTTINAGSFVVSSFGEKTGTSYTALTGGLRETLVGSAVTAVGLNDNASATASSVTNALTIGGSPVDWATVAVELAFSSGTPGWMSWGFGQ